MKLLLIIPKVHIVSLKPCVLTDLDRQPKKSSKFKNLLKRKGLPHTKISKK